MSFFADPIRPHVAFRLRPTQDLRSARDIHRYNRAVETRRTVGRIPVQPRIAPLGAGPLEPET